VSSHHRCCPYARHFSVSAASFRGHCRSPVHPGSGSGFGSGFPPDWIGRTAASWPAVAGSGCRSVVCRAVSRVGKFAEIAVIQVVFLEWRSHWRWPRSAIGSWQGRLQEGRWRARLDRRHRYVGFGVREYCSLTTASSGGSLATTLWAI
jgi:hypothetical protein